MEGVFEHAETLLTKATQEAGNICYRLHPRLLDDFGLQDALEDLLKTIRKTATFEISFQWRLDNLKLDKNVETALFRVIQEALANVLKHSKATKVSICLQNNHNGIGLSIQDNGQGFKLEDKLQSKSRGIGLLNMRERIEMIGGVFEIKTSLKQGVLIEAEIPK